MVKIKCDINQQYLKTVDLHFIKSEYFSLTWSCGSRQRDTTSGRWKFRLNNLAVKGLNIKICKCLVLFQIKKIMCNLHPLLSCGSRDTTFKLVVKYNNIVVQSQQLLYIVACVCCRVWSTTTPQMTCPTGTADVYTRSPDVIPALTRPWNRTLIFTPCRCCAHQSRNVKICVVLCIRPVCIVSS